VVRAHPTVPLFNDLDVFAARILARNALTPRLMRALPERHPRDFAGSRHARGLVTIFLGLRPTLRSGLRVADGFGQHLAELSLGLRRRARCFLPLGHGQYVGMCQGELNPWMRRCSVGAAVLRAVADR
jgi:hypothetical protein